MSEPTLCYHQLPGPDTRRSEPLVLLHGFMGAADAMSPLMKRLMPTVPCIALDLPGHGRSRIAESRRLRDLRTFDDVAALVLDDLTRLGVDRFALYGYSMGGRVAQAMRLLAPERIPQLILESASFGISDSTDREVRYRQDQTRLDAIESAPAFRRFLERWHQMPLFAGLGPTLTAREIEAKARNDLSELREALRLMSVGHQPHRLHRLARSGLPGVIFYGELDEKYRRLAADAAAQWPELRPQAFPGASHAVHVQFPDKVAAAIRAVLERGGSGRPTDP